MNREARSHGILKASPSILMCLGDETPYKHRRLLRVFTPEPQLVRRLSARQPAVHRLCKVLVFVSTCYTIVLCVYMCMIPMVGIMSYSWSQYVSWLVWFVTLFWAVRGPRAEVGSQQLGHGEVDPGLVLCDVMACYTAVVMCDMVLHQAFRARRVRKAASVVRCDMVLHWVFRARPL